MGKGNASKKSKNGAKITHKCNANIELVEDSFGYVLDQLGKTQKIQRFTWKNHNKIEVQVISLGARITTLKLPSRKGVVEDVIMGFDDIAGYMYYENFYLGAVIGRITDRIQEATFVLDKKQHFLTANDKIHHYNGGFKGLDKVVWSPSVEGSKVVMGYVSRDLDDGYPGDLFVRVVFELTAQNEFIIDMEAITTKPTIINLSNLMYFNLGGHGAGPTELYKHIVSINANCFVPKGENGFPTGELQNVIYTNKDFQIPKLLNTEMGINPGDGFDDHWCINRGSDQGVCFSARALHPPSGRILEMYSNQYGMHFDTASNFGDGLKVMPPEITSKTDFATKEDLDNIFMLFEKMQANMEADLSEDSKTCYSELKDLILKLYGSKFGYEEDEGEDEEEDEAKDEAEEEGSEQLSHPEIENIVLNPIQVKYLEGMYEATKKRESVTSYTKLGDIIRELLDTVIAKTELEMHTVEFEEPPKTDSELRAEEIRKENEAKKKKEDEELKKKGMIRLTTTVPSAYKDGRIHGKNDAIYKKHGAMCFQSENYPNAIYYKKFPNCTLRPGESYKHTIVYKFWIQSGDPNKWIKRNFPPNITY